MLAMNACLVSMMSTLSSPVLAALPMPSFSCGGTGVSSLEFHEWADCGGGSKLQGPCSKCATTLPSQLTMMAS